MKRSLRSFLALALILGINVLTNRASAQQSLTQINGWNAYVHLPASYSSTTQSYPTIIFFPGIGEVGNVANKVIQNGPGAFITQGWNGNVQVNGNTVEFIVISLQPNSAFPNEAAMNTRLQTIKNNYRVDPEKLFLTGLSHGGWCASTFITGDPMNGPYTYANQIAAVVTVQGMKPDDNQPYPALFDNYANNGGKYLGFEQTNDGRDTRTVVDRMNATVANSAIYVQTSFGGGGHCCWNQFYGGGGVQPQTFMLDGIQQNIYEWLARQALGGVNVLPTANAGVDQTITLPVDNVQLTGSGTDTDGTVMTYLWNQISGPNTADIYNVATAVTNAGNLIPGVYEFSLKISDNSGGTDIDSVKITVNPPLVSACNYDAPKTYVLNPTGNEIYYPNASTMPWKGGDTLKIPAGNYTLIEISNFTGDSCRKIIITNSGGKVTADNIRFRNDARYFRFTGSGTPGIEYGFKVTGGMLAVTLAHDLEIDHVEATGGNIGMYIKTTPVESIPQSLYITGATNNYLMRNIYIHHNWVHHISGEGFYIGHTGPSGGQNGNGSNGQPLLPLRLDNVEISYNLVEETDWDGIQLSNARNNAKIHHNTVRNFGRINKSSQQAGIIMGGNTNGDIYDNSVKNGTGNGIEIFGYGTINIYNNVIDSAGWDQSAIGQESVLANDIITGPETNPRQQINFYNNTVNNPKPKGAVRVGAYYSNSLPASLTNNQYCIPGALTNWLTTYVIANPTGSTVANNVLHCSIIPNIPPIANAGNDITITLPVNSATLSGSGSDPDGLVVTYLWTKISGPTPGTILLPILPTTNVSGLVQGVYKFELRVTDILGGVDKDTVQVTVNPAAVPNQAPSANAGTDQTIQLPTNSVTLSGTASDTDGTIASYSWSKISGPAAGTINNASSATASATGLVQGVYVFRFTVTDDDGATASDNMQVIVNAAAPPPNQAPSANAGTDQTIQLPTNIVTLSGTASDPDGTIASYSWTKISGPAAGTINNASSATASATGLVQGVYVFRFTVTDDDGATATDNMQVTVNAAAPPPNQAPSVNAGTDQAIQLPTNSVTLSGTATDPDGTIASYSWTKISGPAAGTISNATSASASATGLVQGVYVFRFTATDDDGATAEDNMQVTVNAAAPPPNQAPTVNAGLDQNIQLPTNSVILSGTATDNDGTIASYNWTKIAGPAAGTINNATSATATATGLVQGVYVFRLTVTDDDGAVSADNMQVTVNAAAPPPNQAPTVNAGLDQNIQLPTNTVTLSGTATDPDGTISAYSWTKISGPAAGTISNATSPTTTATGLVQGVYVFRLTVTDNDGAVSADNMQVTVNPAPIPNQAPTVNAGLDQNIQLPTNSVTLSGTATDPDGTIVSYHWTKIGGPAAGTISNATSAVASATGLVQGVYLFRLTVTDDDGAVSADNMQVTVNPAPPNQAPTVNAGLDQNIQLPTNSVTLSGTATDPDGTIVSYHWTKIGGPAAGTISNATSAVASATGLVQGVYLFRLTVTDDDGAVSADNMQVMVNPAPNQAPSANAGFDQNIQLPTNSVTLTGTASDPDGTIASYHWTKISGPAAGILSNTTSATAAATGLVQGVYVFRFTVTDNDGAVAADNMQVTVNAAVPPPNQTPTVFAGLDQNIQLPTNSITLSGTASDPDGTIASYNWTKISGPAAGTINNASSITTIATGLAEGVYIFRLTVTDNNGAVASDNMQVTVNAAPPPPNQAPTANAGSDIEIYLPVNNVTLSGTGTDPDGSIVSYHWTVLSGPSGYSFTNADAQVTSLNNLQQGNYEVELTVTDNDGATAKDIMFISVGSSRTAGKGDVVLVYPNPVVDIMTVEINTTQINKKISLVITDIRGAVILKRNITLTQNVHLEKISLMGVTKGHYNLLIQSYDKKTTSVKILKM